MPTYTSNYGWTKPSGSDNVDISVLNNNLDGQDGVIHDAFLNMAPPFSESSTYAVDDIVLYTTGLYKCHTAVVTPGSWTGSTNWQVYKLSEGGGGGTSNYNDLTNKPSINGVTLTGNKTTSDLGINADNVMMSDGVTSTEDAIGEVTSELNSKIGYNSTTNLDACIENGIYLYLWDSNNAPGGHAGVMLVMSQANKASGVQIARSATVNTIYVRFWDSSTFTAWSQVKLTT